MKIYAFPPSPNSRKVLAAAKHLGLDIEVEVVNLIEGEQLKPEFVTLNPNHKTPTLVDGGFVLWESNAIMQYLAAISRPNSLCPADPRTQADISRWQCWQLAHWGPACGTLIFEYVLKSMLNLGDPDMQAVARAQKELETLGAVLNQCLQGRNWLVGDAVTLADFSVGSWLQYAEVAHFSMNKLTDITHWYDNLSSLPAWSATDASGA